MHVLIYYHICSCFWDPSNFKSSSPILSNQLRKLPNLLLSALFGRKILLGVLRQDDLKQVLHISLNGTHINVPLSQVAQNMTSDHDFWQDYRLIQPEVHNLFDDVVILILVNTCFLYQIGVK